MTSPDASPGSDLCRLSATDAARLIASQMLSPVDLVEAVLAQAERLDPVLRVFALPMADAARRAAHEAQATVRAGSALGPLHGVPITIKDNVAIGGLPMRQGSAAAPIVVPAADAEVVRRIKAAGAIIIGKTTLPEFAHKVLTDNVIDGVTRNPWRLDRTPGGSSGGASAALAVGIAPLAVGTDGGGSVRCPASCTGTVGLKGTLGRIPNEAAPDAFGNFFFIGPMARTVTDVRLLLSVMQGNLPADPYAVAAPGGESTTAVRGVRIGWVEHFGHYRTEVEVSHVTRLAMESLAARGAHVEPLHPACFEDLFGTYRVLATSAHATRLGHLTARQPDALTPSLRDSIEQGRTWSAIDLLRAQDRRTVLFRAVQDLFETVDVIATPTMTAPPLPLDAGGSIATDEYGAWAAPLYPFNMTGHPALSIPAGFTQSGLPVGLQLVGRWYAEPLLLDIAAELEAGLDLAARYGMPEPTASD